MTNFSTWGTNVNVHAQPTTHSQVVRTLPGPTPLNVVCQVHGEQVTAEGFTNNGWASVPDLGGFVSIIYINSPDSWLTGVPECAPAPPPPPPPGGGQPGGGNVHDWIAQAVQVLEQNGVPPNALNANDIWTIIQNESSGNPNATNNSDANARAGHPSKGLMQTTDPTFNQYKVPGHDNIYNPVDNIIAGVRYALARYHSLDNVPGIRALREGRPYVGY
jgi:hypothetical protein